MKLSRTTDEKAHGKRLDQYLKDCLPDISRGRIQKAIRSGACLVDGQPVCEPDFRVATDQRLELKMPESEDSLKAEKGDLKILWHDDNLAVCDKEPGLTVHPCPSCPENTLIQRLLSRFPQLAAMGGERPGIVHRLDKDTSGLLLIALTEAARLKLSEGFASRKISKEYLALVHGVPEKEGICLEAIGRHPEIRTKMAIVPENRGGKAAHSAWRRLWVSPDGQFSLVSVRIFTGRTHQIRVHMAYLGHPILGDQVYASAPARDMAPRQMLHAARLAFSHPLKGEKLHFFSPLPEDFRDCLLQNSRHALRVVVTGNPGCGKSSFTRKLAAAGLPVIDADAIVAELYAQRGHVSDWLSMRGFTSALASDGSVSKTEIMKLFEQRPDVRREFESFVHALVRDNILDFWRANSHQLAAVAEVPLFFECGWQKVLEPVLTVGIHCDQDIRFKRLARDRNWSEGKIQAIESWQMPETDKMARCDLVYDNMGSPGELSTAAADFIEYLEKRQENGRMDLLAELSRLSECDPLNLPS